MKKLGLTLCFFLFFWFFSYSIERPNFLNAVANNTIAPTIQGNHEEGACIGKAVEISVQNNTNNTIETTIEKGTILRSQNPETQDMVVTQDLRLNIGPNAYIDPPLNVFCIQYYKHAPTTSDYFQQPSSKATGDLMKLVNYIDSHQLYDSESAQIAIWSVTDNIKPQRELDVLTIEEVRKILSDCNISNQFTSMFNNVYIYFLSALLYMFVAIIIIKLINRSI